jgi:hypothetical protein
MMILIKIYDNMNNFLNDNVNFEYGLVMDFWNDNTITQRKWKMWT